jgi:hypothetical protein
MKRPRVGQRVKFVSLDSTVLTEYGISPSGDKVQVRWDDGAEYTHAAPGGASCVYYVGDSK